MTLIPGFPEPDEGEKSFAVLIDKKTGEEIEIYDLQNENKMSYAQAVKKNGKLSFVKNKKKIKMKKKKKCKFNLWIINLELHLKGNECFF